MTVSADNLYLRDVDKYFEYVSSSILGIPTRATYWRHSFMDRRVSVTAPGGIFFEFTFASPAWERQTIATISEPFRNAVYEAKYGVH